MKILYISHSDLLGQQFNGYAILPELHRLGHNAFMAVDIKKDLTNPYIHEIGSSRIRKINKYITWFENKLGSRNILPIQSLELFKHKWYLEADIVHLQLLHATTYFSLLQLKKMTKEKKVVWTMHDPWLTTGHCIYSLDCTGWMRACNKCPYLDLAFPIPRDTAWLNWRVKNYLMSQLHDINLIVASSYMENLIKTSAITSHLPVTKIHFGIDTTKFYPQKKELARKKLGLPLDAKIISFRSASYSPYKGTPNIEEALSAISSKHQIILATMDALGGLEKVRGRFPVYEIGWTDDPDRISTLLSASDIFLMPSTAEAFGLMALEAMACGTPLIVFDGTALPEVIGDAGLVVPMRDSSALANAIDQLLENDDLRIHLGKNALRRIENHFTLQQFIDNHIKFYEKILHQ
jgi:glycosyltransferase involved in cell wall biosynthesis